MSVDEYSVPVIAGVDGGDTRDATRQHFFATAETLRAGDAYDPHLHDEDQLVWMEAGCLSVVVAGGEWLVRPDHLVWLPAGVLHRVGAQLPGRMVSVYIDPALRPRGPRWSRAHTFATSDLTSALLRYLVSTRLSGARLRRCGEVLIDLLAESPQGSSAVALPHDPRARTVAQAFLDDPRDPRELEDWAAELGVSTKTIARSFVADTGSTFREWRVGARMHAARSHLHRGVRVAETARLVGYDSTSSFIAAFRARLGVTPSVYAAQGADVDPAAAVG